MPRESVKTFYENLEPKFETYKGVAALSAPGVHEAVVETARTYVAPGSRVLDIGCGRGALALRLHDSGYQVEGCDIFDLCEVKDKIKFIHSSAENAKFEGTYDAVFLVEFLIATESPYGIFRQYLPLVRPGGYVFVSTANVDCDRSRAEFFLRGRHHWFDDHNVVNDGAIAPFFRFQVEFICQELGVEIVERKAILPREAPPVGATWTILNILKAYQRMKGIEPEEGQIAIYVGKKGNDSAR